MENNTPISFAETNQNKKNRHFWFRFNHWFISSTFLLIAIILLISFLITTIKYPDLMPEFLKNFKLSFLNQNWKYTIKFFSLNIYTIFLCSFCTIASLGIFFTYKKRNFWFGFTIVFTIILIVFLLTTVTLLLIVAMKELQNFWSSKSTIEIWLIIIPWMTAFSLTILILIDYLIMMLYAIFHPKSSNEYQVKTNKSKKSNHIQAHNKIKQPQKANLISNKEESQLINNVQTPPFQTSLQTNDYSSDFHLDNNGAEEVEYQTISINEPAHQWGNEQIEAIWNKGRILQGYDPKLYRRDYAGAMMFKRAFVNTPTKDSEINQKSYNWTIVPQSPLPGKEKFDSKNLLPMNTINALSKGDDYPRWKTTITYDGKENIYRIQNWRDQ